MLSMEREKFSDWLLSELKSRGMTQSELARLAGLGSGTISNIMIGNRQVGQDTLAKISHALKLPTDLVFEKAGILPSKPELSPVKRKLAHLAEDLPDSDLESVIAMLEQRQEYYKKHPSAKPAK